MVVGLFILGIILLILGLFNRYCFGNSYLDFCNFICCSNSVIAYKKEEYQIPDY